MPVDQNCFANINNKKIVLVPRGQLKGEGVSKITTVLSMSERN